MSVRYAAIEMTTIMIIITCDLLIDLTLPCEPGAGVPAEQLHGQQARPAFSEDRHRDLRQGQVVPALLQVLRRPQGLHLQTAASVASAGSVVV